MNEQMIRALLTSVDTDFEAYELILIETYDATNDTANNTSSNTSSDTSRDSSSQTTVSVVPKFGTKAYRVFIDQTISALETAGFVHPHVKCMVA